MRDISIDVWRFFSDLELERGEHHGNSGQPARLLHSAHLKPGVRPDQMPAPQILVSPCDAIKPGHLEQSPEPISIKSRAPAVRLDLLCDVRSRMMRHRDRRYVTLRLTVEHVPPLPCAAWLPVEHVSITSRATLGTSRTRQSSERCGGSPEALLQEPNARYHGQNRTNDGYAITLRIPVKAQSSSPGRFRLRFIDVELSLRVRGQNVRVCLRRRVQEKARRWDGSSTARSIIVFAPDGFSFCDNVREGTTIRVGQPLMQLP